MAWRRARLMICEDLWSASALVKALVELVFSVLVLLSSLLFFLTVTFGQAFNLRRPSFWESRRPERRGACEGELTVLCEHHAKQISSLKSSISQIAVGMSNFCELCALALLYCSCKKPDSGPDNRNSGTSIAVQQTRAAADEGIPSTDSFTFEGREFPDGSAGSMKKTLWNNKVRERAGHSELAVCPTCGLAVTAAPYENRSVKRRLARGSTDDLRVAYAERGSKWDKSASPVENDAMTSLDLDSQHFVSRQAEHRKADNAMSDDYDQLCRYRSQGRLSRSNSLNVGMSLLIGREGSFTDASHGELEASLSELDSEGGECSTRNLSSDGHALSALYTELEEERNASATAASEAMAMITRLQEEKAMIQMEARHYQRMVEEKSVYDQDAISLLQEILVRKDEELSELASEVKIYRRKLLAGNRTTEGELSSGKDGYDDRLQHEGRKLVFSDIGHRRRPSGTVDAMADHASGQPVFETAEESSLAPRVEDMLDEHLRDREFVHTTEDESLNQELAGESNVLKDGEESRDLVDLVGQSHLIPHLVQNPNSSAGLSQNIAGTIMEAPKLAADDMSAAGNSCTMVDEKSVTQAATLPDYLVNKEVSKSVQTANEIVKSRERFLDALKSSAALSLLEEQRQSQDAVEGPSAQKASSDAETARNIVLEEHRLSVLEYVRKFEGQSGRKQASQLARGPSSISKLAQKEEQLLGAAEGGSPVEQDHSHAQQGRMEQLPEETRVSGEKTSNVQTSQGLGALKEVEAFGKTGVMVTNPTRQVPSDVTHEENAVCLNSLGEDVDELEWQTDGAESPVLDVYEVSSGYATDHRHDAECLVLYNQHDLDGHMSDAARAWFSRQLTPHDSGNRLGKPDTHPEVICGHGKDRIICKMHDFRRQNNDDLDASGMQPGFDSDTSYATDESGIPHALRPVICGDKDNTDWRTRSMVSRDAYRAMMEEEALCLISRLEAVEADRQAMRQTIESLRRENGEMKVLQEITQQVRELRGIEKKSITTPEHWQKEDPSSTPMFKGMLSFTRLRCTVQAQLNKIARLFLRNADTGVSPGEQVGLRLLQNSPQPPVVTCITRGVRAEGYKPEANLPCTTRGRETATSLTSLLSSEAQARPGDSWVVDATGRHGTALGGWGY